MATAIQTLPPNAAAEPRPRPFSIDEYYRLGREGLFEGQRVELIEGEIVLMSPQGYRHVKAIERIAMALEKAIGAGFWIRRQYPLALSQWSEPEPDISVVAGDMEDYDEHPATALLVVEVSDATRAFDRGRKAVLYAKAAIAEYWVVDLVEDVVVVHRQPDQGHYRDIVNDRSGQAVSPLAWPARQLQVSDLLPAAAS